MKKLKGIEINKIYGAYKIKDPTIIIRTTLKKDNFTINYRTVLCECIKCGKEKYQIIEKLRSYKGNTGCKSCSNKENPKSKGNGCGELSGTFFHYIKKRAKSRNLEFTITKEFLWNLYLKQNEKCALSSIPIKLIKKNNNRSPNWKIITASLDRIDPTKGYIENNVQWVHKVVNIMKNTLNNNDFIYICKKINDNNDNFEPSITNMENLVVMKVQRLTLEDSKTNNSDTSIQHPSDKGDDIV